MYVLTFLQAFFSFRNKVGTRLSELLKLIQPPGSKTTRIKLWHKLVVGFAILLLGYVVVSDLVPILTVLFHNWTVELPPRLRLGIYIAGFGSVIVFGALLIRILASRLAMQRTLAIQIEMMQQLPKLVIYVYGSGSVGFCRAIERLSEGSHFKYMAIFAHPPIAAFKKGVIALKGALTLIAPVQYAMGSHLAATMARKVEGTKYASAHNIFCHLIGAQNAVIDYIIFHKGDGHTSETCCTEWGDQRTTRNSGSTSAVFVWVVSDAVDISEESDDLFDYGIADSVVKVKNDSNIGTGVVIGEADKVLTCAHVLGDNENNRVVSHDGSENEADIVYVNHEADIAVLKVASLKNSTPITPGDSSLVSPGDSVTALGYPLTNATSFSPSVSQGVVSQSGYSDSAMDPSNGPGLCEYVVSDVPATEGYSGGPLIKEGRFVGLITSRVTSNSPTTLALSSNSVIDILKDAPQKTVIPQSNYLNS